MTSDSSPAEIVKRFDNEDVRSIDSIESAMELLKTAGIAAATDVADLIGDGFSLTEKRGLVNIPFLIFDMKIVDSGDYGHFSVVRVVTADGRKCVITDGGTGVHQQVQQLVSKGVTSGVLCKSGLTVSDYDYTDEKGVSTPAHTFYFAL